MKQSCSFFANALSLAAGALTIVLRIVPHSLNFSSIGGMSLFGGAKLRTWHAFALPILVMIVSDSVLWYLSGFNSGYAPWHISRTYVYGSLLVYVVIGHVLRKRESWGWIIGASLLGSLQFFVITNFAEWLLQPLRSFDELAAEYRYPRSLGGLIECFVAALPFFRSDFPWDFHAIVMRGDPRYGVFGTILGDLVFTCGLFGLSKAFSPVRDEIEASDGVPAPQPAGVHS